MLKRKHILTTRHNLLFITLAPLITLCTSLGISSTVSAQTIQLVPFEQLPVSNSNQNKNSSQNTTINNKIQTMLANRDFRTKDTAEKQGIIVPPKVTYKEKDTDDNYSLDKLLAKPALFNYHMNQMIADRNFKRLQYLLPHYKTFAMRDPFLVDFAQALLYELQGKHRQSITLYKKMLAQDPSLNPVRLHLATTLMKEKNYANAKNQFLKLRSEHLPKQVLKIIDANLIRIDRMDDWNFNASANYVSDKNINNAPSKKLQSSLGTTVDPIHAKGVYAYVGAYKKFYLINNLYTAINANASGNTYWNVDGYNDYSINGGTAIGYMNSKTDVALKPTVSKRIYDNKSYSTRYGAELSASHWISPQLRLSASTGYDKEIHDDDNNQARNSDNYQMSVSGFYTHTARDYFYGGLSKYRSKAKKSAIISYDKKSAYVGWGREWNKGISSKVTARYSRKKYDDPAKDKDLNLPLYYNTYKGEKGTRRTDTSHSITTELWKRDYDIVGLTPKLVIDYDKTNSNFLYYDDKESLSGTIKMSKTF